MALGDGQEINKWTTLEILVKDLGQAKSPRPHRTAYHSTSHLCKIKTRLTVGHFLHCNLTRIQIQAWNSLLFDSCKVKGLLEQRRLSCFNQLITLYLALSPCEPWRYRLCVWKTITFLFFHRARYPELPFCFYGGMGIDVASISNWLEIHLLSFISHRFVMLHLLSSERTSLCESSLSTGWLAKNCWASGANNDGLSVREDCCDGETTWALDVHEEWSWSWDECLFHR